MHHDSTADIGTGIGLGQAVGLHSSDDHTAILRTFGADDAHT